MASKWASLPIDGIEGGRSPSLLKSARKSVAAVASIPMEAVNFSGWGPAAWLFIAVIIVVVLAVVNRGKTKSLTTAVPVGQIVTVPTEPQAPATVEPKSVLALMAPVASDDFWNQAVDLRDEPYLQSENGQAFADYQQAFLERGMQKPVMESKMSKASTFLDPNMMALDDVPEAALMAFEQQQQPQQHDQRVVFGGNVDLTDSEARQLAQEAFQTVPKSGQPEAIANVLSEILAARNEATKLGLVMPSAPEEQTQGIKYWSKRSGPAAALAKTILSRM